MSTRNTSRTIAKTGYRMSVGEAVIRVHVPPFAGRRLHLPRRAPALLPRFPWLAESGYASAPTASRRSPNMAYRVIQWSTGNVGKHALRGIIHHPDLELVGLWVHGRDKAGRDAGELCGLPPVGVKATNDADTLLAMKADCVSYTATGDLRPSEAVDDMV